MSLICGDIVVATGNAGKVEELARLLESLPLHLRPQSEFAVQPAEETGATFIENAILKARAAASQSGLPALADDSGLEVDALMGSPGVHSARYSIEATDQGNNAKLLEALQGIPEPERTARFHCVLVLLRHADDPVPLIAQGCWEGSILEGPRGNHGFGYDPLFLVQGRGLSAAELVPIEKNRISHRGIASRRLLELLRSP